MENTATQAFPAHPAVGGRANVDDRFRMAVSTPAHRSAANQTGKVGPRPLLFAPLRGVEARQIRADGRRATRPFRKRNPIARTAGRVRSARELGSKLGLDVLEKRALKLAGLKRRQRQRVGFQNMTQCPRRNPNPALEPQIDADERRWKRIGIAGVNRLWRLNCLAALSYPRSLVSISGFKDTVSQARALAVKSTPLTHPSSGLREGWMRGVLNLRLTPLPAWPSFASTDRSCAHWRAHKPSLRIVRRPNPLQGRLSRCSPRA